MIESLNHILGGLDVLGLGFVTFVIGTAGACFADTRGEFIFTIISAGVTGIATLGLAGRKALQAEDKLKPRFVVSIPESFVPERRILYRNSNTDPEAYDIIFICFTITNDRPEPLVGVEADVLKIKKPSGEEWVGRAAVNFGPRDSLEEEKDGRKGMKPKNKIPFLKPHIPENACLCSATSYGAIFYGTLDWNWLGPPKPFSIFMDEAGEYIFTICISADDGSATKIINLGLFWDIDVGMTSLRLRDSDKG